MTLANMGFTQILSLSRALTKRIPHLTNQNWKILYQVPGRIHFIEWSEQAFLDFASVVLVCEIYFLLAAVFYIVSSCWLNPHVCSSNHSSYGFISPFFQL